MFNRRPDATLVREMPIMRAFLPYVAPRRNDSLFFMKQDFQVEAALEFAEKKNRDRPEDRPITLFHLFLRSCSQALYLNPRVNRFVKGGKLWQRKGEWITFSAMRQFTTDAPMLTIKRRFHSTAESLDEMVDGIYDRLSRARGGEKSTDLKEMSFLLRLPGPVIRAVMATIRMADGLGVLPRSFIDADPLFTSVFIGNLGSIGYPAGFHHLWEYGTASLFGVMGKIEKVGGGRRKMTVAWTYDERIDDGLYSFYTLEGIRDRLENPERLLTTPERSEKV